MTDKKRDRMIYIIKDLTWKLPETRYDGSSYGRYVCRKTRTFYQSYAYDAKRFPIDSKQIEIVAELPVLTKGMPHAKIPIEIIIGSNEKEHFTPIWGPAKLASISMVYTKELMINFNFSTERLFSSAMVIRLPNGTILRGNGSVELPEDNCPVIRKPCRLHDMSGGKRHWCDDEGDPTTYEVCPRPKKAGLSYEDSFFGG
jgi:hypothetical protein